MRALGRVRVAILVCQRQDTLPLRQSTLQYDVAHALRCCSTEWLRSLIHPLMYLHFAASYTYDGMVHHAVGRNSSLYLQFGNCTLHQFPRQGKFIIRYGRPDDPDDVGANYSRAFLLTSLCVVVVPLHGKLSSGNGRPDDPEDVGATQRVPGDREHEVLLGWHAQDYAAPVCRHAAGYPSHSDTQLRSVDGKIKGRTNGRTRGREG